MFPIPSVRHYDPLDSNYYNPPQTTSGPSYDITNPQCEVPRHGDPWCAYGAHAERTPLKDDSSTALLTGSRKDAPLGPSDRGLSKRMRDGLKALTTEASKRSSKARREYRKEDRDDSRRSREQYLRIGE